MHEFYRLPQALQLERLEALARRALPAWNIDQDAVLRVIGYRENAVFAVTRGADGGRLVLKIHRQGYHSDAELESEMLWMEALAQTGVATPRFLFTGTGARFHRASLAGVPGERQIDLSVWVDGEPLGGILDRHPEPRALARVWRTVGETAARLHAQARAWKPPAGFTRPAWDAVGFYGADPLWGRFWEVDEASRAQRRLLRRARDALHSQLRAFAKTPDRYGLIHADLEPENILVSDARTVVIDFDDCGYGWNLYDLATAIYAFCIDGGGPDCDTLRERWIEGYRSVAELPDEHLQMLPALILTRWLTVVGWCHTRRETDTAQRELGSLIETACALSERYLKDPGAPA